MRVWPLGWEDPLEEGKATHSLEKPPKTKGQKKMCAGDGQRGLAGCDPRDRKVYHTTEAT